MASERHRRAVVGLLIVVTFGGCRGDLFRPEPEAPVVDEGLAAHQPWQPYFRAIGTDGEELRDFSVDLQNYAYYDDPRFPLYDRGNGFTWYAGERDRRTIHPPLELRLRTIDGSRVSFVYDAVPAVGDTLVIDARDPVHAFDLTGTWPAEWGRPDVRIAFRGNRRIASNDGSPRWIRDEFSFRRADVSGLRFGLAPEVEQLESALVLWGFREGDDDVAVSQSLSIERDVTGPMRIAMRFEPSTFHVRPVHEGRAVRGTRLRFDVSLDEATGVTDSVRFAFQRTTDAMGGPVSLYTVDPRVQLEVRAVGSAPWFVERRLAATVATGDTVEVELGSRFIEVEVVDAEGLPQRSHHVRVRAVRADVDLFGSVYTDHRGRGRIAVMPGLYDVRVRRSESFSSDEVFARVRVDDDVTMRVVMP